MFPFNSTAFLSLYMQIESVNINIQNVSLMIHAIKEYIIINEASIMDQEAALRCQGGQTRYQHLLLCLQHINIFYLRHS